MTHTRALGIIGLNEQFNMLILIHLMSPLLLKVKKADETSQAVHHQSARLKADVRVLQKERDSLKHELAVLHKRLQNASDKVQH